MRSEKALVSRMMGPSAYRQAEADEARRIVPMDVAQEAGGGRCAADNRHVMIDTCGPFAANGKQRYLQCKYFNHVI
jgi:hypothetical protein